ncbi:MAG: efflux transporter outer membrane subunit [Pseudomonadota bacterium]|nr:efflux transporter outer membrane subunit [Pseudomonadota bacterium]
MINFRSATVAVIAAVTLGGCMVGPDFRRPEPPATSRYTDTPLPEQTVAAPEKGGEAQRFVPNGDLSAQWWTLFNSEALDRLVRDALAESPTLAAAQATLRQARENLAAEQGALLLPKVDGNLSATRQKTSGASFGQPGAPGSVFTLYNASVNVSYALDAFGGNRRELEGLQALVDYQGFQLEGARLSLTANVVTTAIREAELRARLKATQEILAAEQKQVELIEKQFELGAVARLVVTSQRTQVEQTRALLPALERDLAKTRHQLAVLSGRLPSEAMLPEFDLDTIALPQELPLSLPSLLTRQRPDVQAAEALLHQASAQIGVATANEYPKINLTGSLGEQSLRLGSLFAGPAVWSVGAGLLQPLFHGGELEARRRAAVAAYEQADAQYRQTVLLAFQNVADALRALEADARTLKAQSDATAYARQSLELTQRQYQLGGTGILALLIAQQQFQQERLNLVTAQSARYADTAALFQALGGCWWNREPQAAAITGSVTN